MASNAKTRARKKKQTKKQADWWKKFRQDTNKVIQTGEEHCNHYVGGGQAFTRKAD